MAYHPEDDAVICATCGREQEPGARFCPNCGAAADPPTGGGPSYAPGRANPARQSYSPGTVPNYLVQSILVTIFCCLIGGIVAIVHAAQVNGKLRAGDYAGAVASSNSAKQWCWASFWIGLVGGIIYGFVSLILI